MTKELVVTVVLGGTVGMLVGAYAGTVEGQDREEMSRYRSAAMVQAELACERLRYPAVLRARQRGVRPYRIERAFLERAASPQRR